MSEENKAIARKVYEIIATGDLDRANEIVDPDAPDNERPPGSEHPHIKLLESANRWAPPSVSKARNLGSECV